MTRLVTLCREYSWSLRGASTKTMAGVATTVPVRPTGGALARPVSAAIRFSAIRPSSGPARVTLKISSSFADQDSCTDRSLQIDARAGHPEWQRRPGPATTGAQGTSERRRLDSLQKNEYARK